MQAIRAEGLTKSYGSTLALDALDLTIERGEIYGYLGPNGSGKTTTIRLLLGLHRPTAGRAELFGLDAWREPVAAHRHVAYVAGEPYSMARADEHRDVRVPGTIARLHRCRLPRPARRTVPTRHGQEDPRAVEGQQAEGAAVAAFATRADLLILDEPTSGLDPLMEVAFRQTVLEAKEHGQTVFLSSHILSEVEALCDRVGILREGRLVDEGTLAQLRHLTSQTVEVTFAGPPPDLATIPGVQVVDSAPNALRLDVSGSPKPLLAALAGLDVIALTSREQSLEEIFLHHYDAVGGR